MSSFRRHGRLASATVVVAGWIVGVQTSLLIAGAGFRSLTPGSVFVVAIVVALLMFLLGVWIGSPIRFSAGSARGGNKWIISTTIFLGLLVGLQYVWRAYHAWRFPLMDWDGMMYHVVKPDVWLMSEAIVNVPQAGFWQGYPASGELNILWFMVFSGNDHLADMASLPSVLLLICGTALVARLLGAERWLSVLGGLLVGAVPAVFLLGSTAYVDVPSAATAIAAMGLILLAYDGTRDRWLGETPLPRTMWASWIIAGALAGISMGTKIMNVLIVAIPLLVITGWVYVCARRRLVAYRSAIAVQVSFGATALVFGGYWYVVNLVVHANPVYPFRFGPFSGPLEPSDVTNVNTVDGFSEAGAVGRLLWSWTADFSTSIFNYDIRPGGFGFAWPLLMAPALVIGAIWLARRRAYFALAICWVPAVLIAFIGPMSWWARLTLLLIALGGASFAVVTTHLRMHLESGSLVLAVPISVVAVALAVGSMVLATTHSNYVGRFGYSPGQVLTLAEIIELSKEPRSDLLEVVSPWGACRGFESIRSGSLVATDGFRWPHLVVGPDLARVLARPLASEYESSVAFEAAVEERGLDYVILDESSHNAILASTSSRFRLVEAGVCAGRLDAQAVFEYDGE